MRRKWTDEELLTLDEMAQMYTLKQIAFRLKKRGYYRTRFAISKKLYALGYSTRPILDNYSCEEIAKTLHYHSTTVTQWVRKGWLKAQKRSATCYQVRSHDLKRFLKNPPQSLTNRIAAIDPQIIKYLVG
ncbi:hypothetical protein FNW02_35365 [Komarekiella sp. 'clone 1']|uniref:Helix-turn-helix domain-containing protein n=1 Tax=Komarekiella delphini-convector SJRDD-AB1 TaxID=2593771 RepID=A0AA40T4N9_9NOST|nr:hypothetical protein [Komarekiella delphini-convector]MBD6620873.1 hypothetical protein [Komarekiella delphini-convector SJRDD-AB1]